MDNTNLWIAIVIITFVIIVVMILAVAIGYFWASSKTKSDLLKQFKEQNEAIYRQAQEQLNNWKEQELSVIKQQTFDAAKGQATQEMQEQIRNWQEGELQRTRQQIFDAVKGQATQEMQEQMRKWQEGELQQTRQQIFAAVKGQATQEMQEQMRKWQEGELQSIKKQMSDAIRGETIQEAQQQFVKWKNDELENTKRQLWDVLSKDATNKLEQWKVEAEGEIRKDAIVKSQSVTKGKMTEHMVPYLPGFGFNPTDARFIGSPIDLVVFDGLSDGDVKKIVFVEIKTGVSTLSTRERFVRNAVQAGSVEWLEIKVNLETPDIVQKVNTRKISKNLGLEFESELP